MVGYETVQGMTWEGKIPVLLLRSDLPAKSQISKF
jgi:hypothetical protein